MAVSAALRPLGEVAKERRSRAEAAALGGFAAADAAGEQPPGDGDALPDEERVRRLVHDEREQTREVERREVRHARELLDLERLGEVALDVVGAQQEAPEEGVARRRPRACDPRRACAQRLLLGDETGPERGRDLAGRDGAAAALAALGERDDRAADRSVDRTQRRRELGRQEVGIGRDGELDHERLGVRLDGERRRRRRCHRENVDVDPRRSRRPRDRLGAASHRPQHDALADRRARLGRPPRCGSAQARDRRHVAAALGGAADRPRAASKPV
jgi:hypothetical protein